MAPCLAHPKDGAGVGLKSVAFVHERSNLDARTLRTIGKLNRSISGDSVGIEVVPCGNFKAAGRKRT